jgi:four helix bundle protein
MYIYSFEKLEVWKLSKALCVEIYAATRNFPTDEKFGLTSQMRRAVISISSNIAEGSSRITIKEQSYFYSVAFSSAIELLNQFMIAKDLVFVSEEQLTGLRHKIEQITKMLSSLRNKVINLKP